jgi:hypothetical protein
MLDDSSLEHSCRLMSSTTFLRQGMKTLEDDTFPVGETVFYIQEIVTRVMAVHEWFSPSFRLRLSPCPFTILLTGRLTLLSVHIVRQAMEVIRADTQFLGNLDDNAAGRVCCIACDNA